MCSFIHLDSTLLRSAGCFVYRQVSGVVDEPKHQPTEVHPTLKTICQPHS